MVRICSTGWDGSTSKTARRRRSRRAGGALLAAWGRPGAGGFCAVLGYASPGSEHRQVRAGLRSGGLSVRVLGLPALIEMKERAGRPKDLAALPVLRATLDELSRRPPTT